MIAKVELELNIIGPNVFLNFWDYIAGQDVVCEINGDQMTVNGKPITIKQFVAMVKRRVKGAR